MTDIPPTTTTTAATSSLPVAEDYTELHENENENENNKQQSVSPTGPSHIPSPLSSSPKPLRKSHAQINKHKKILIVFASTSKYQWLIGFLVVVPLFAILMAIILFDVKSQEEYKNSSTVWVLGWCFILIMVLYMAILPRQVDVRSNGTVAIKTCLLTFHIDDIARAYRGCNIDSNYDSLLRPRVRFATSFDRDGAVVIRRHHGKWDVVVTPQDPEGFVHAVEDMVRQKEDESHDNFVVVGIGQQKQQRKPNLSSTSTPQPVWWNGIEWNRIESMNRSNNTIGWALIWSDHSFIKSTNCLIFIIS